MLSELFNFARLGGRRQSPETRPKGAWGQCDGQSPHCEVAVPRLGRALGSGEMWEAQHPWRCSLILVLSHTTCWKLSKHLARQGAQEVPYLHPLQGHPREGTGLSCSRAGDDEPCPMHGSDGDKGKQQESSCPLAHYWASSPPASSPSILQGWAQPSQCLQRGCREGSGPTCKLRVSLSTVELELDPVLQDMRLCLLGSGIPRAGRSALGDVREIAGMARQGGVGHFAPPPQDDSLGWEESKSIAVPSLSSPGLPAASVMLGAALDSECLCAGCRGTGTGHRMGQESRLKAAPRFPSGAGSGQGCPGKHLPACQVPPTRRHTLPQQA